MMWIFELYNQNYDVNVFELYVQSEEFCVWNVYMFSHFVDVLFYNVNIWVEQKCKHSVKNVFMSLILWYSCTLWFCFLLDLASKNWETSILVLYKKNKKKRKRNRKKAGLRFRYKIFKIWFRLFPLKFYDFKILTIHKLDIISVY